MARITTKRSLKRLQCLLATETPDGVAYTQAKVQGTCHRMRQGIEG
jgi:hypothetical protein